jgi:hypothetical protein
MSYLTLTGAGTGYVSATPSGATYGYYMGGSTGGTAAPTSAAQRMTYSTGVIAAHTASDLPAGRMGPCGISDKTTYGYFLGGFTAWGTGASVNGYRLTYSTEATAANTASNLSYARGHVTGVSDGSTYGYASGGVGAATSAVTDLITFSTSATAANTASNLSEARSGVAGVSDGGTYGYICGGFDSGTNAKVTTDRITFSTSATASNTASKLSKARVYLAALSDGSNYGYVAGGDTGGTQVTTADRITFSTSATAANTVSNLSAAKSRYYGASDGNAYGYFAGGRTGSTNLLTTDRITFSTGVTAANTVSNFAGTLAYYAAASNFAV